jgi:glycosyltransferase involved in cell wall biosynthesis
LPNKVSILIPVQNEEKYIEESLSSILNQTYKNIEIIIVDDGSTDNTLIKLEKYKIYDWIKIISTEGIGKNAAFNLAFKKSTGNYICYFAGDDVYIYNSIEIRLNEMLEHKEDEVLLMSKLITLSDNKNYNNQILPKNKQKGNMAGGSLMFTRKLIDNIFPIPKSLPNEDLWSTLYCQMMEVKTIHLPIVTYKLRIHENNSYSNFTSFQQRSERIHARSIAYGIFLEKYRDILDTEKINYLALHNSLEILRYKNNLLSLLFLKDLEFKEKIRYIFYSNEVLYNLRVRLNFIFSGWI